MTPSPRSCEPWEKGMGAAQSQPSGRRADALSAGRNAEPSAAVKPGEATVETLWDREGARSAYQTRVKTGRHFRIHIFWRGDRDPDMHDHPADFWTFPLVSYVEEVKCLDDPSRAFCQVVRAFRPHFRRAEYAHRVLGAWNGEVSIGRHPSQRFGIDDRPIVTLGWWRKKRRDWGFHTAFGWVPWKDYVNAPGWSSGPPQNSPSDGGSRAVHEGKPEVDGEATGPD